MHGRPMRRGTTPRISKVGTKVRVARQSTKSDDTKLGLEKRLVEALVQQRATSEISSSPADVDSVFRMILANAVRLCRASVATLWLFDGEVLRSVGHQNASPEFAEYLAHARIRPGRETTTRRAALERKTIHVDDLLSDADYSPPEFQRKEKVRTVLSVPLLGTKKTLIGVVTLWRRETRPFTDGQIALVKNFADHAVIAIENARLFNEVGARNRDLAEALEQQTATSDILRVISRSPTDVQPVFDTIAAAVLKLCRGTSANVVTFDGKLLHVAAQAIATPGGAEAVARLFPRPLSRDNAATRAVLTCSVVMIPDVLADAEFAFPDVAIAGGFRSILAVPLVRQRFPIGAIVVGVAEPGPFADKQVALLKTFADQAVIAIENVRLFRELELRNRDLTEALEQQTATSEILSVISKSQTDVQPVFDTIVRAALDLCRAHSATVLTFDGELLSVGARALADATPEEYDAIRKIFPRPAGRETAAGRAVLTRELVAIPDVLEDPEYENKEAAINGGFRSAVAIPLLRDGNPIGTINVGLREPGPFPAKQMMLLQTFADQAVIAIENV
ncbi:MAG: GAF domain-containing protein, partial [Betaproteobacteria bacterium]